MVNPVKEIVLRDHDPTGHGYYGAKRGRRKHRGVDIVVNPKTKIFSPIHGYITKHGYVYGHTPEFRYVEVTGDVYRVRLMYVFLTQGNIGDRVIEGKEIGSAQDVGSYWGGGMLNHIHYEVYKHGLLTDPEPLLRL